MSKPIRSYSKGEQQKVIDRRLAEKRGGLGYLSALDSLIAKAKKLAEKDKQTPVENN